MVACTRTVIEFSEFLGEPLALPSLRVESKERTASYGAERCGHDGTLNEDFERGTAPSLMGLFAFVVESSRDS